MCVVLLKICCIYVYVYVYDVVIEEFEKYIRVLVNY